MSAADDNLARIEDEFRGWTRTDPRDFIVLNSSQEIGAIGLALVEIARAAQRAVGFWNDDDPHSLDSAMLAADEALARLSAEEGA